VENAALFRYSISGGIFMDSQRNTCEVCGQICETDQELKKHMLAAHDIEAEDEELSDNEETAA
jgi:hypothetical protein